MNAKIIQFLKDIIDCRSLKYTYISEKSGIEYQRLMRIFEHYATVSGSELLCLCKTLEVKQDDLLALLDE